MHSSALFYRRSPRIREARAPKTSSILFLKIRIPDNCLNEHFPILAPAFSRPSTTLPTRAHGSGVAPRVPPRVSHAQLPALAASRPRHPGKRKTPVRHRGLGRFVIFRVQITKCGISFRRCCCTCMGFCSYPYRCCSCRRRCSCRGLS